MPDDIAFLFPGQGSQRVGMGAELMATDPDLVHHHLDLADRHSGLPVSRYALDGPLETLTETQIAQPAIFAVSLVLDAKAAELGLQPSALAGHSLGEYTAAVAGGALSLDSGMRLVCERGRLMSQAQATSPGAMAAIAGLSIADVNGLCEQAASSGIVVVANLNSDQQVVVSGQVAAVERVMELARAAAADNVTRLNVGAAFHSPLMQPVQDRLAAFMASLEWSDARIAIYANAEARPVQRALEVRDALLKQISSPVRWADCMAALRRDGCATFLELGPGRVLTGLARLQDPETDAFAADSAAKLERFRATRPPA